MNSEHALKGLVVAIKKTLEKEHEAHVPGLGIFRLVEKPSRLDLGTDGKTSVSPPVRTVEFSPNPTESA